MLMLAFFATLVVLRATRAPGAGLTSGIMLMAFGIWMLWAGTVRHQYEFYPLDSMPRITSLLLGAWLVVKGALRFSA
jgi:fatty acid desaturase